MRWFALFWTTVSYTCYRRSTLVSQRFVKNCRYFYYREEYYVETCACLFGASCRIKRSDGNFLIIRTNASGASLGIRDEGSGYTRIRETIGMQMCAGSLSVVGLKNLTQTRNLINTSMTFALNWVVTDVSCGLAYTVVRGVFKLGRLSTLEAEDKIEIGEVEVYVNIYLFPFILISLAISIYSKISLHI